MPLRLIRLVVLAAALVACAACDPPPGPAGTVTAKEIVYKPATKTNERYLTVRKPSGGTARFLVNPGTYDNCRRGSAYPACDGR
ncbi:hypothetical protein [Streptomyces sp. NPDC005336]|uniref:hypothetical protein n=1 Tax=Streptomyces sp. NPDC005336 TaxID=3157035 RepID=UPI0033BCD3A1